MTGQTKRAIIRGVLAAIGTLIASLAQATFGSDLTLNEVLVAFGSAYGVGQGLFAAEYFSKSVNPTLGHTK